MGADLNLHSGHSRPAFDLADALVGRGHRVVVVSSEASGHALRSRLTVKGDRMAIETPFENNVKEIESDRHKRRAFRKALENIDIIHEFDYMAPDSIRRVLTRQVPIVYTANKHFRWTISDVFDGGLHGLTNLARLDFQIALLAPDFLLRRVFSSFDGVLCTSKLVQTALGRIGIAPELLYRVPPWLNPPRTGIASADEVPEAVDFLYYGWGSDIRGVSDLLDSFRLVEGAHPEASLGLHFTGRHGLEERLLSKRIDSIKNSNLRLYGFDPAIFNAVSRARSIVLPFRASFGYAQPPLTVLESMALGKAIITTDIASIPEVVSHMSTGILVPPRSPVLLARSMVTILEDSNLAITLGFNAKSHFDENFDVARVVALIERIYRRVGAKE